MAIQCPAIKVQDFNYTNNFALIIKLIPNSYQVMTDTPIDLSKDLIPKITIDNSSVDELSDYVNVNDLTDQYNEIISNLKSSIDDQLQDIFSILDNPEDAKPNCDPTDDNSELNTEQTEIQIDIKDSQGNIIKEIISSIQENPSITCEVDGTTSLVDFFELPETFDPIEYQQKDPVIDICNLPDSAIKNQVNYIVNELPEKIENLYENVNSETINTQLKNLFPKLTGEQIESIEDLKSYYDNIKSNTKIINPLEIKAQLGIPLATLEYETPVIMQIINKKLQVLNLYDGTTQKMLEIDKEIELNVPIITIFKTNGFLHELYLIIEGDPNIYKAQVFTPKNLSIYYIGIDNEAQKNLCGLVMDIQILTYVNNPAQEYLSNKYNFTVPQGCLAFYDWHKDRINRNLVFPLPDLNYPVKMYGDGGTHYKIDLSKDPYHFMSNSYLSEFFCSKNINQEEWSIWFWFYVDENMPYYNDTGFSDFRTIIYDFINKNSLEYDFGTKMFKFNFNSKKNKVYKPYLISLNTWYFCVLKYKQKDSKIYFSIKRIDIEDLSLTTVFEIPIEDKLNFNLTSMLASFDGWSYNQFFNCKFGTLALFDRCTTITEENDNFLKNRIIIQQLDL